MVLHTNTYELLNPPRASRSSLGRVFIYLLLLNISDDDTKLYPYYVGTTSQLSKRFGGHAEIHWHWNTYKTAPKIYVVGTVDVNEGLEAVVELKTLLSEQGFYFKDHHSKQKKFPAVEDMKILHNNFVDVIPDEWYEKFSIKTGTETVVKKNRVEEKTVAARNPTVEQMKKFFEQANLNINDRVIYEYLTGFYNPSLGKIVIDANDSMLRMLQVSKKKNKFFIIPVTLPRKGTLYLPLQKSLKEKMGDILI